MSPTPDLAVQSLARRIGHALRLARALPDPPAPAQTVPRAAAPLAPTILSRAHVMARARQEASARYEHCLNHFRSRVQRGAPEDDASLALAYFVLANVAAAHDLHPRSEALERVEAQMRHALAGIDSWRDARLADRQAAFEQFAVLAVLVADATHKARREGGSAMVAVRREAQRTLAQWLDVEPSRLVLGERGLALERAAA